MSAWEVIPLIVSTATVLHVAEWFGYRRGIHVGRLTLTVDYP